MRCGRTVDAALSPAAEVAQMDQFSYAVCSPLRRNRWWRLGRILYDIILYYTVISQAKANSGGGGGYYLIF